MKQKLERLPNWHARLTHFILEVRNIPLIYGKHDCMLFPAGAIWAMTGVDLAKEYRERYSTALEGMQLLRNAGYRSQYEYIRKNFEEVHPAFAKVGDIALVKNEKNVLVGGIIQGEGIFVLSNKGLILVQREKAVRTYKVGD